MWIARDKNGELYLYDAKPIRETKIFMYDEYSSVDIFNYDYGESGYMQIDEDLYPEVTWENSPVELVTKITR